MKGLEWEPQNKESEAHSRKGLGLREDAWKIPTRGCYIPSIFPLYSPDSLFRIPILLPSKNEGSCDQGRSKGFRVWEFVI